MRSAIARPRPLDSALTLTTRILPRKRGGDCGKRNRFRPNGNHLGVSRRPPIWRDSLFFRVLEPPDGWENGREGVHANQRARMLDAMTRCVASKGYARVSVADVVQNAGVSRRTFYEQFRDKEDCFLVAYDTGSDAVIAALLAAVAELEAPDWRSTLRTALQTYTTVLAADPEFAHAFLIDVLGAGPQAVERRKGVNER